MDKSRLSFGMRPESPSLRRSGIILKILKHEFSLSSKEPIRIYGCCRIGKEDLRVDKKSLPAGVFVSAVEVFGQRPVSANMIREQIVFEDDIEDQGTDYVFYFQFDLVEAVRIPLAPFTFIVHASFFNYVSNLFRIELTAS